MYKKSGSQVEVSRALCRGQTIDNYTNQSLTRKSLLLLLLLDVPRLTIDKQADKLVRGIQLAS